MTRITVSLDKTKILSTNLRKGNKTMLILKSEIAKDTEKYVPFRDGTLRRSVNPSVRDKGKRLVYNTPYAAFQYGGKVMVGVRSNNPWAHGGETKKVTGRSLTYGQPGTGKEWWKVSKAVNINKWRTFARKVFKNAK